MAIEMRHLKRLIWKRPKLSPYIPTFLCPIPLSSYWPPRLKWRQRHPSTHQHRGIHIEIANRPQAPVPLDNLAPDELPWVCPGCGAYSQSVNSKEAGYYSTTRKPVRAFRMHQRRLKTSMHSKNLTDNGLPDDLIEESAQFQMQSKSSATTAQFLTPSGPQPPPVCDRCHNLHHHNQAVSIVHPTLTAIQAMLSETPYKKNHVWHVLDAADFPLSLIPHLHHHLKLTPQRGQNRRARNIQFSRGGKASMSFLITRSDLLAPRKHQVDTMMPYLIDVLRRALGTEGKGVRLGNVHCVSSHRGWWTRKVKEEVIKRGGGQWMVGKANVGKSQLLQNIYPKARSQDTQELDACVPSDRNRTSQGPFVNDRPNGLLPPVPKETAYPVLPLVSHLPGTTASPIRLPFGRGKGEIIDLPGLPRGNLEHHVVDEHKPDLVMRSRQKAKQFSIKPGQSLVISNIIRITPTTSDLIFLACPFIPLECHVTNTEKAKAILAQESNTAVKCIAKPGVDELMDSAGKFDLKWDVTKHRSGPLTRKDALDLKLEQLHYIVYSLDILIEGVGWIELAAQVRKSTLKDMHEAPGVSSLSKFPTVEVFSPNGAHVGSRKPIGAWMLGGQKRKPKSQRSQRPRRSMKGMKKAMKKEARALQTKIKGLERAKSVGVES